MTDQPLIELRQCSVSFDDHLALAPLDFALYAGQRWVVTGANGAGKSVLLKLLRGDVWPTPTGREQRRYAFDGQWHDEPAGIKHQLGFVAPERQDRYVRRGWNLRVRQVVTTGLFDEDIPLTKPTHQQMQRVDGLLRRLRLWALRDRRMLELSYGQRRRVLLARLLAGQPCVWLLDEVFNGLDEATRGQLLRLLADARQAPTWMLAVHSVRDIPASATHLLSLRRGQVVFAGPMRSRALKTLRRDAEARHRRAAVLVAQQPVPMCKALPGRHSDPVVRLQNVQLFRDYRAVLRDVQWSVARGEHWAIMGHNGSGKSTLLLMLYGNLHPAHGGVIERTGMPRGTPISRWKQHVGFVSPELQADHVWTQTVEELVASGRYASIGLNQPITAADRRAATPWLRYFHIEALRARSLRQVSYGQLRLAILARALIQRPGLLLLDEPFTGLDPDLHAFVRAALQRLTLAGTQVIMAIHEPEDALPAINHVLRIGSNGRVTRSAWTSASRSSTAR